MSRYVRPGFESSALNVPLVDTHPLADRFTRFDETAHSEYVVHSDSEIIAKIVRADGFGAPEHVHPEAQISLFRRGSAATFLTHSIVGKSSRTSVAPGSVAFIPHHQPHRTHWQGDGELLNIYFSPDFMLGIKERTSGSSLLRPLSYRQESTIHAVGQCLLDEFYWSGEMHPDFVDHARFLIATRLLHIMQADGPKASTGMLGLKRLQPAVEFLNERSESHTSLTKLASLCGVSVYHFARSFSAQFGRAPFEYQRALRLERARNLLRDSDLAIEAVGSAVGFESASNFARMFRRKTGVTPSQYRHMYLESTRVKASKH